MNTGEPDPHSKPRSKSIDNVAPPVKRSRTAKAKAVVPDIHSPPVSMNSDNVAAKEKSRRAARRVVLGVRNID